MNDPPFPERFISPPAPELSGVCEPAPVAIVGAGPVGLTLALDLAHHGVRSVLLEATDTLSVGSRAICWAKRSLQIFDRLGIGEAIASEGVTWRTGRVFHGDTEVYAFDLQPDANEKMPAFVNLQQNRLEAHLVRACERHSEHIDLRWRHRVTDHTAGPDGVTLQIASPEGDYPLQCGTLVAADGARSPTRTRMGLTLEGERFDEAFLIADVETAVDPFGRGGEAERWFWFEPPFHNGQSALLHKQPGNIYRIDLQLGPDADDAAERDPERVRPRVRSVLDHDDFRLDWLSVYRFRCARLSRFVHGRVVFAGDSAHVVSPFGARGGNGGVQDADALGYKLAEVVAGGDPSLLADYEAERIVAAEENILHSGRATAFMTPRGPGAETLRDAVLALSHDNAFARRLVNSGRLSEAARYPFCASEGDGLQPGEACPDARLPRQDNRNGPRFLLELLNGRWCVLTVGDGWQEAAAAFAKERGIAHCHVSLSADGTADEAAATARLRDRYGTDSAYLVRPDQHVAARATAERGMAPLAAALPRGRRP